MNFSGGNLPTPFRQFGDQLAAVAAYTRDPATRHPGADGLHQIQAALGMNEGISSDAGWLVQTDFTTELLRLTPTGTSYLRQGARGFPGGGPGKAG